MIRSRSRWKQERLALSASGWSRPRLSLLWQAHGARLSRVLMSRTVPNVARRVQRGTRRAHSAQGWAQGFTFSRRRAT
jgi:hypothetical protein